MTGVLIEHEEERGEIWRTNLLLCGEACGGGGRRKRGEKSDRLDYECTHRRTLFNVSLTFLFSVSSPLTRSRRRDGQERRRREMERGSAPAVLQPRSGDPDKVRGQGSPQGQPIRTGQDPVPLGDDSFQIHLLPLPSFVFSLPTPAVFHPSVPSFIP